MPRRVLAYPAVAFLGLGSTGCLTDGGAKDKTINGRTSTVIDAPAQNPASLQAAERVDTLGRRIVAQNPFTGLDPLFHTVGVQEPGVFHRGTGEVFITEGLVKKCETDAQLAAVLCSELAKMMAEKRAAKAIGVDRDPISDVPGGDSAMWGGMAPDQTRLAELAMHEKKHSRDARRRSAEASDPAALSRELMTGAGFDPKELDAAAPLIRSAGGSEAFQKQVAGPAPVPTWSR